MQRAVACLLLHAAVASAAPVDDLFARVLGARASDFKGEVVAGGSGDTFTIVAQRDSQGRQVIRGNTVGSAASGLGHYLAEVAKVQIRTWSGSNTQLPTTLPAVPKDVTVKRSYTWGYYQNVCTVSYTMAWWGWERWEEELDWMALNGINMPLAFTGQEYVWQKTFEAYGLTYADLVPFFSGPAFFAWQRMGNLKGWGGPLPETFVEARKDLQVKILQRAEELGMTPVLPAFAGHIPEALTKKLPNITYTRSEDWGGFSDQYGSVFYLEATDPMFVQIGKTFVQKYRETYITKSVYFNGDQYNEMSPASGDLPYLAQAGKAMYDSLAAAEPKAVWVMQGWLFVNDPTFWTADRVKAYLDSVPDENMLILDLYSEDRPEFSNFDSYYGKPFIWNMLHNYGGNTGMYGEFDNINQGPQAAGLNKTTIRGFGLTMEGTRQNYALYELMLQNIWRSEPHADMTKWSHDYSVRRYGGSHAGTLRAWELLYSSVYSGTKGQQQGVTKNIIQLRPRQNLNYSGWMPTYVFYDPLLVEQAASSMLSASDSFAHQETYINDLVDVTKQAIANAISLLNINHTAAYQAKNATAMQGFASRMMDMATDMDTLLGSSKFFLLGTWIKNARAWGGSPAEQAYYEWNARNQVTLWGPNGEVIDYAAKEWSGLVSSYYVPRWQLYFKGMHAAVTAGKEFNQTAFNSECLALEQSWQHKTDAFPSEPQGDAVAIAKGIISKYFSHLL
eukprot:TRINITY_DN57_c15_g3_i1.p1 TRINITY_DN57_c15_g3~~TRINITY_DN57_c15_g3_i1.p1  ORF type:complete len:761 (+),score=321.66 TRINITY_DN57_c15_g3_i1:91-2283(+)